MVFFYFNRSTISGGQVVRTRRSKKQRKKNTRMSKINIFFGPLGIRNCDVTRMRCASSRFKINYGRLIGYRCFFFFFSTFELYNTGTIFLLFFLLCMVTITCTSTVSHATRNYLWILYRNPRIITGFRHYTRGYYSPDDNRNCRTVGRVTTGLCFRSSWSV